MSKREAREAGKAGWLIRELEIRKLVKKMIAYRAKRPEPVGEIEGFTINHLLELIL